MEIHPINIEITLPAPPAEVFSLLTETEDMEFWAGEDALVEKAKGGRMVLFDGWVRGEVLAFEPPRLLAYTWEVSDWPDMEEKSVVTYVIMPNGEGSLVRLTQNHFPSQKERDSHEKGWHENVFEPLRDWLQD